MTRDKVKGYTYFSEYINYQEERYERFEKIMKKVIEQRGENDNAISSIYSDLLGFQLNKMFAMYSIGKEIRELVNFIPRIIDNMEKIKNTYSNLLTMLSIAIIVEIDHIEIERLKEIVENSGEKDFLIDFLFNYLDPSWEIESEKYQYKIPYAALDKVIKNKDENTSIKILKDYLQKLWYKGNDDTGWHDTHKITNDYIYCGYWSFESGAIAKILQLDDSILMNTPYYPYDMVHYQKS